jgi:hypothetical protein
MELSPSLTHKKLARYYNGLSFGINAYLRSHINWNFTMSIVQAHINNCDCQVMIVSYVTLLSQELEQLWHFGLVTFYYLIHRGDKIFCISSFLKTGVIGLNDNSNPVVYPATSSDFDLKHLLCLGWRNLSKTAE